MNVSIGRAPLPVEHPKLTSLLRPELRDLSDLAELLRRLWPRQVLSTAVIGQAMPAAARRPRGHEVVEVAGIHVLSLEGRRTG